MKFYLPLFCSALFVSLGCNRAEVARLNDRIRELEAEVQYLTEEREIDVQLPTEEALPLTSRRPAQIIVNIHANGDIFVDDKKVDEEEVSDILQRAAWNAPPHTSVIIQVDERCELKHAVLVMNACNVAGIADYSLTTEGKSN